MVGCVHEAGETLKEMFGDIGGPTVAGYEGDWNGVSNGCLGAFKCRNTEVKRLTSRDDEEYKDSGVKYVAHLDFYRPEPLKCCAPTNL